MTVKIKLDKKQLDFPFSTEFLFSQIGQINIRKATKETVKQVNNTKVVFANYDLLMNDFPQISESELIKRHPSLKHLSERMRLIKIRIIIDKWLIKHGSYISSNQSIENDVNTKIDIGNNTTQAYRPTNYGRALIFAIEDTNSELGLDEEIGEKEDDCGLIDVKGVGVDTDTLPLNKCHYDGLMSMSECFRELLIEQLIHQIFLKEQSSHTTLPIYAIIDLGFDQLSRDNKSKKNKERKNDSELIPVGLTLRRAHNRIPGNGDLPDYRTPIYYATKEIELMLRKYGITSANSSTTTKLSPKTAGFELYYSGRRVKLIEGSLLAYFENLTSKRSDPIHFEGINIQITADFLENPSRGILVDFGQYNIHDSFENPIVFLASDRVLYWGDVQWPQEMGYIKPEFNNQGYHELRFAQISSYEVNKLPFHLQLSEFCRSQKYEQFIVSELIQNFIKKSTSKWK